MNHNRYKNWKTDPRKRFRLNGEHADISWYYWNLYHPDDPIKHKDNLEIHHKDFNHSNNDIDNLQKMTRRKHMILHGKHMSEETKMKMSKNHADFSGNKNPYARTIMAEYQIFPTITNAAKIFDIPRTTISSRLKSQKPGYMYL